MEEEEDEKAKEPSKNVRRSKYLYKGIKFCFWYFIIFEGWWINSHLKWGEEGWYKTHTRLQPTIQAFDKYKVP